MSLYSSAVPKTSLLFEQSWFTFPSHKIHPLNQSLTNRTEYTQRFALRVILSWKWNLSHDELLSNADLPLLSKRRDFDTLCHLYTTFFTISAPFPTHSSPIHALASVTSTHVPSIHLFVGFLYPIPRNLSMPMHAPTVRGWVNN